MHVLKVSSAVKRAAFRVPDQGAVVRVDLLSLMGTRNVSPSLILGLDQDCRTVEKDDHREEGSFPL